MARPISDRGKRVYENIAGMVELFPSGTTFSNKKFISGDVTAVYVNNALNKLEKEGLVEKDGYNKSGGRGRPSLIWKKV